MRCLTPFFFFFLKMIVLYLECGSKLTYVVVKNEVYTRVLRLANSAGCEHRVVSCLLHRDATAPPYSKDGRKQPNLCPNGKKVALDSKGSTPKEASEGYPGPTTLPICKPRKALRFRLCSGISIADLCGCPIRGWLDVDDLPFPGLSCPGGSADTIITVLAQ